MGYHHPLGCAVERRRQRIGPWFKEAHCRRYSPRFFFVFVFWETKPRILINLCVVGKDESVVYPDWSNNNLLTFISDRSNWWNLYQLNSKGETEALCPKTAEFAGPHWVFGDTPYAFIPDSDSILGT